MCCAAPGTLCPKAILWLMIFEPLFEIERQVCKFLENNLLVYISKYSSKAASELCFVFQKMTPLWWCSSTIAQINGILQWCVHIRDFKRLWSFKWGFLLATSDLWFIGKTEVVNILAIEFWLLDTSGLLNPLTFQEFRIRLSSSFYFVHLSEIGNNFWYY